jgi:hypothetical protein
VEPRDAINALGRLYPIFLADRATFNKKLEGKPEDLDLLRKIIEADLDADAFKVKSIIAWAVAVEIIHINPLREIFDGNAIEETLDGILEWPADLFWEKTEFIQAIEISDKRKGETSIHVQFEAELNPKINKDYLPELGFEVSKSHIRRFLFNYLVNSEKPEKIEAKLSEIVAQSSKTKVLAKIQQLMIRIIHNDLSEMWKIYMGLNDKYRGYENKKADLKTAFIKNHFEATLKMNGDLFNRPAYLRAFAEILLAIPTARIDRCKSPKCDKIIIKSYKGKKREQHYCDHRCQMVAQRWRDKLKPMKG